MLRKKNLIFTISVITFMTINFILILPVNAAPDDNWKIIWQDEFNKNNSTGVDTGKWSHDIGGDGWGNNELEYYTDRTENSYHWDGHLTIKAMREDYGGSQYTSARIISKDKFSLKYGRVEMKASLPYGQGIWPAFWMLGNDIDTVGWPKCGEIDIMEYIGPGDPNRVFGTIHGPGYSGSGGVGNSYYVADGLLNQYHTFAIEWEPDEIRWYYDDILYHTATPADTGGNEWVFDHEFFLLLNLAVGGNWPGYPDASTTFPQYYNIDYVRVYKLGDSDNNIAKDIPARIEAEDYIEMYGVETEACAEGGQNVGYIDSGDWMKYRVNVPASGDYTVKYRVATLNNGCQIILDQDSNSLATIDLPNTDGWQNWTTISHIVHLDAGEQNLAIYAGNGGFNVNWFEITGQSIFIEAESYDMMSGIEVETCTEGGQNVGYIDTGDWILYDMNIPASGTYNVEYRIASQDGGGQIILDKNGGTGLASIDVPRTGGWQNWLTISHTVYLDAGQQTLAIYASSGGFNVNWLKFTRTN